MGLRFTTMIEFLHMIINIIVQKKANYVDEFLSIPNDFFVANPSDFQHEWMLKGNGALLLEVSFIDVSLYDYLADYGSNKTELDKWLNRVNVNLNRAENVSKWRLKGFSVVEDNSQKRIKLGFCQW